MSEEVADDNQLAKRALDELGANFNVGYIGVVIEEELGDLSHELAAKIERMQTLIPHITNTRVGSYWREKALEDFLRLQMECAEVQKKLQAVITMLPDLGRHVTITHT